MADIFTHHITGVSLVYGILVVLYSRDCDALYRATVSLSDKQTFIQAANNQNCTLVGLGRTGEITENDKYTLNIDWRKHFTAWIGAHMERVWIQFEGCYTSGIAFNSKGFDLSNNTVKTCLSHCQNKSFFLTHDKCFCYQNEVRSASCSAGECQHSADLLCGSRDGDSGMFFPVVSRQCACHYGIATYSQRLHGDGDCMLATYRQNRPSPLYSAVQCNQKHLSVCQDPRTVYPDFVKTESSWYQSLANCYHVNYHILGIRGLPFRLATGSYWAGSFSVAFYRWGIIRVNGTTRGCTAATATRDGKVTLTQLPCNTPLPALCYPSNKIITDVIVTTNTGIALPVHTIPTTTTRRSTSAGLDVLKAYNQSQPDTQDVTSIIITVTVVGSVMLLFVASLVVVFVCVRRRGSRRDDTARGFTQNTKPGEVDDSRRCGEVVQYIDTLDNVYDELNEFRRDRMVSSRDMYDHAFTGETGSMYGHLNAGNYQYTDSDYDHTFSAETADSYGHLGTTHRQNINSDHDHVFGGESAQCVSMEITNTGDNAGPHVFDIEYDDVRQSDTPAVAPVYAQVVKRSQRKLKPDSE